MLYTFSFYVVLFISYSFFGWVIETISCSFIQRKVVLNRGFLIGPYCPIYGWCSIFMILCLRNYLGDPIVLFILIMVVASILEYFTSLVMEKLFNARWWDYSNQPLNIEGRISLANAVLFGFLGITFMYGIHPFYSSFLEKLPDPFVIVGGILLCIAYLVDNVFSFFIMAKLKLNIKNIRQDASELADKEMKKFIANHHFTTKRLFSAFPKMKFSLPKGEHILESIKKSLQEYEKAKTERKANKKKN